MTDIYKVSAESLTQVAQAIRDKSGMDQTLAFPQEFVSAIEGISTGGGPIVYECGTYCPEEDKRTGVTLTHSLGVVPTFVVAYATEKEPFSGLTSYLYSYIGFSFAVNNESHFVVGVCNPAISGGYSASQSSCGTETTFRINAGPTYKLKAGVTYRWMTAAWLDA